MAARRLVALLVALMVISVIATALAPPQRSAEESSSTSTTTTGEPSPDEGSASGEAGMVNATIDASAPKDNEPVRAKTGDQLALSVRSGTTIEVEISGLGLYETAARGAPALFDLILREEGEFEVLAGGEPIGTILVGIESPKPAKQPRSEPEPPAGEAREGRQQPKGQGHRESGSSVAA